MVVNETAQQYYAAIGEFTVVYAGLEMHLVKFISTRKANVGANPFGLSVMIARDFDTYKKAKKIDEYINFHIHGVDDAFKKQWQEIFSELNLLYEARQYLIHGPVVGFVYYEPLETFIADPKNANNLLCKKFYLKDIQDLILLARNVMAKLVGDFWHKYARFLGHTDLYITSLRLSDDQSPD